MQIQVVTFSEAKDGNAPDEWQDGASGGVVGDATGMARFIVVDGATGSYDPVRWVDQLVTSFVPPPGANQARIAAGSSRGPAWPAPLGPGGGTKDVTSWSTQRTGSKEPVAPSTTMNRANPVASPATPPLAPSCHSSGALPSLVSLNVTTWICIAGQSRTSTLVPTSRNLTRL